MASAHAKLSLARSGRQPARRRAPRAGARLAREEEQGAGVGQLARVARGGILNLAGAAVSATATVAATVAVTREFSKPVAGAFFTAMSLFLIAEAMAGLGAFTGLVYFVARLRALGADRRIPAIIEVAILPVAFASAVTVVTLAVGAGPLAGAVTGHLGRPGADPQAVTTAIRVLALALPFATLLDTVLGASRGYRAMGPTVFVDRIGRSTAQLAGIGLAVAAGSAALLAPLWALPYLPAAAVAALWLRRIRRRSPSPGTASRGDPARPAGFWRFTAPRALASLAQITIQRLDIVLVAILQGPAAAAVYTAATRFLVAGQLGNGALSMAAQPRFTELFTMGNRRAASHLYQATTGWLILLTWPLYLLAVIYGPQVLTLFGHSYRAGHPVMIILGLTMLLATACGQVDMVLITTGRSGWSLANGLLAVGINITLDLLLIPRYGITGAAVGWAAAIVVTNLLPLAQIAVTERLHPFSRGTVTAVCLSAVAFGGVPAAARGLLGDGAWQIAAAVAAACALQLAGLRVFRGSLQLSALPFPPAWRGIRRSRARHRKRGTDQQ
ncbi:MAG: polysaccharide biosynthesis C-terminal domain-containing protein [Actinobacteria bacterium]|nr:polysaccharide biosynthesis C-terminal domain-containing protein [Actinomycetota bacterium]